MKHLDSLFLSYLALSPVIGYVLVFFIMMFEGDAALFTAAFLTSQGYFDFWEMTFTALSGVLIGNILWYWAGWHLDHLSPFLNKWSERIGRPFDDHLLKRTFRTFFISKFTYGVHHALLVRAGALKMSLGTFIKNDFFATIIWFCVIWALGYTVGASFVYVKKYLKYAEIALLISLAGIFYLEYTVRKRSKEKL